MSSLLCSPASQVLASVEAADAPLSIESALRQLRPQAGDDARLPLTW